MKKVIIIVLLALVLVVCLPGCGGSKTTPDVTSTAPPETTAAAPVTVTMSFPEGAAPLNQSKAFRCVVSNKSAAEKKISLVIDANPSNFVLESGSLSWNGTVPANSEVNAIEAVFKSYHTGHWEINANYHIETGSDGYGGDFTSKIYVDIGMTSSEWGNTPPWQK
jgi:hypothetical protein